MQPSGLAAVIRLDAGLLRVQLGVVEGVTKPASQASLRWLLRKTPFILPIVGSAVLSIMRFAPVTGG